jgi:hypothetical protein
VKGVARSSALSAVLEFLKLDLPSLFLSRFRTLSSLCDSSISGLGQNQGHRVDALVVCLRFSQGFSGAPHPTYVILPVLSHTALDPSCIRIYFHSPSHVDTLFVSGSPALHVRQLLFCQCPRTGTLPLIPIPSCMRINFHSPSHIDAHLFCLRFSGTPSLRYASPICYSASTLKNANIDTVTPASDGYSANALGPSCM